MKPARKINPWNTITAELEARSSTPDQLVFTTLEDLDDMINVDPVVLQRFREYCDKHNLAEPFPSDEELIDFAMREIMSIDRGQWIIKIWLFYRDWVSPLNWWVKMRVHSQQKKLARLK